MGMMRRVPVTAGPTSKGLERPTSSVQKNVRLGAGRDGKISSSASVEAQMLAAFGRAVEHIGAGGAALAAPFSSIAHRFEAVFAGIDRGEGVVFQCVLEIFDQRHGIGDV